MLLPLLLLVVMCTDPGIDWIGVCVWAVCGRGLDLHTPLHCTALHLPRGGER